MGDIQRGFNIANDIQDNNIVIEIAGVCEQMKQWQEAAKLFQKGGLIEKAASIYIQIKMFSAAAPLIDQITSPTILIMVAKAKEAEKQYKVWIKEKKWLEGREDAGKTALKRIK